MALVAVGEVASVSRDYLDGVRARATYGYEAAAYSKWAGKILPTTGRWNRGIRYFRKNAHVIVPNTNLAVD